jgi:hypothetical protein
VLKFKKFQLCPPPHALARIKHCLHESLRRSYEGPIGTAASPTFASLLIPSTSRVSPLYDRLACAYHVWKRIAVGVQMQVEGESRDALSVRVRHSGRGSAAPHLGSG